MDPRTGCDRTHKPAELAILTDQSVIFAIFADHNVEAIRQNPCADSIQGEKLSLERRFCVSLFEEHTHMKYAHRLLLGAAVAAVVAISPSLALAGKDEALTYLEEARSKIQGQYWDEVKLNLELAETEAANLPEADKAQILAQVKSIQDEMVAKQTATLKPRLVRDIERSIDDAKPQIGNAMFDGMISRADEILADETNRAILGADAEKYIKQIATFRKLHKTKFAEAEIAAGQEDLTATKALYDEKMAEIQNPDTSPNGKASAIEDLERKFAEWDAWWALVPAGDARVVEMKKAIEQMKTSFTQVALADRVNEVLESLKRGWELYQSDWEGHESETPVDWKAYKGMTGNEKIDNFGAPKSRELVERYESFLRNREEDENYQSVKDADAIKTYMESLAKTAAEARARVLAGVKSVVDGADGDEVNADSRGAFDRLEDSLRVLFTNDTGGQDGTVAGQRARIIKKIQTFVDATEGAEKARDEWYRKMSVAAKSKWAEIAKEFDTEAGFDPGNPGAFKGKLIKFETDNLMGWRFKPGDFAFASTIDGLPIAGRYSADVKKAIEEVQKQMGRDLGDNDNDGRWTVIARVTGKTGRMMQKKQAEGDIVSQTGSTVGKYTVDYADPVDAPIIEIVAARCGPLAVGEGVGMAKEDGSVGSP